MQEECLVNTITRNKIQCHSLLTERYIFVRSMYQNWDICLFFTARVRCTREGNIYTWECLSVHHCGGGYPVQGQGGYPIPGLARGGTPSQVWLGGYPISGWGYPKYPPNQVWMEGTPYPDLRWGTPPPRPGMGYSPYPDLRWGIPPYLDLGQGTPPHLRWGTPPPPPLHTAA